MLFTCTIFSFLFEVPDLDDAKDNAPPPPSSSAADFPAETKITNPVSKKRVTVKKITTKSEPKSLRWVNNFEIN